MTDLEKRISELEERIYAIENHKPCYGIVGSNYHLGNCSPVLALYDKLIIKKLLAQYGYVIEKEFNRIEIQTDEISISYSKNIILNIEDNDPKFNEIYLKLYYLNYIDLIGYTFNDAMEFVENQIELLAPDGKYK